MPRAKGGFKTRRRRKKIIARAKGYTSIAGNVFRKSKEQVEKSLNQAYSGRKQKKRDYRALWIVRINAAVRQHGLSYSKFMGQLKANNIELDRKTLSEMAIHNPEQFEALVKKVS